jgi:DNA-binding PadR family transcriptional regulator
MRHHHSHFGHHLLEHFGFHLPRHASGRHHDGDGGRHGRHGGFGRFGDDDGFTRGRKFSSEDLQLLLLALLLDKPAHGYELIKALETRSNGFYTPSPGMVYPALTYLEELGQVTVTLEGNRKCYTLADTGRKYIAENQERVDYMLAKLKAIASKMDSVRRAYSGEAGSETEESNGGWVPELHAARKALKSALHQIIDVPAEQQLLIATILQQATKQILDASKK